MATNALLNKPYGVFVDGSGNIYIADTQNSLLRVVNPGSQPVTIANVAIPAGDIQTVAGIQYDLSSGPCQFTGDNGPATSAYLCQPESVFVDGSGAIYIADWYNPIIQHGEVDFRDPRRDHTRGRIWRVTSNNSVRSKERGRSLAWKSTAARFLPMH